MCRFRKSCIDCVFCLRYKHYRSSFPINFNRTEQHNLTKREITELKNGTASFLFEDNREQDKWIKEYKRKEEESIQKELANVQQYNNIFKTNITSHIRCPIPRLNILGTSYDRYREFGMKKMPDAPEEDYLACWKQQWDADGNADILKTLKSRKCKFFYPLNKKEERTLSACNEEVLYSLDNKKFWKGVFATLIVGIVIFILGKCF